jgi:hypothetical protein
LALTGTKSGVYHRAMVPLYMFMVVKNRVPRAYPCGNEPGDVNDARTEYTGTAHSVYWCQGYVVWMCKYRAGP